MVDRFKNAFRCEECGHLQDTADPCELCGGWTMKED